MEAIVEEFACYDIKYLGLLQHLLNVRAADIQWGRQLLCKQPGEYADCDAGGDHADADG